MWCEVAKGIKTVVVVVVEAVVATVVVVVVQAVVRGDCKLRNK